MLVSTVTGVGGSTARSLDEELVDLVCADEQWLREEFDAIVAREWAVEPPAPPPRGAAQQPDPPPRRPATCDVPPPRRRRRRPAVGRWRRQRSPP
jgi:hypothetical protein